MRVLVTGADGMVAQAVAAHCRALGDSVSALSKQDLDITRREAVSAILRRGDFGSVINCAAYTDVDGAESEPEKCFAVNAVGVANLAAACAESNSAFVTISTDYVFDGEKEGFYTQDDPPNPLGFYARSKLEGERLAQAANLRSIIVRSGWIFGRSGTNFLSVVRDLLADGTQIKAISDAFGTPTFADDLAVRLRELAEKNEPGVFHVVNGGPGTNYIGFAEMVCEKGGFDKGLINSITSDELDRPAPRPRNSRLSCLCSESFGFAALPDWEDAIARFVG